MKIAREVDSLMWSIAETGDFHAIENFKRQFPDLHAELSHRVLLIKDLKKAKSLQFADVPRPPFVPPSKAGGPVTWPMAGLVILVVSITTVAFVTHAKNGEPMRYGDYKPTTTNFQYQNRPRPHSVNVDQPAHRVPTALMVVSPNIPPNATLGDPASGSTPGVNAAPSDANAAMGQVSQPKMERLHVTMMQAPLSSVIGSISSTYKIDVKTAPGFPNPTVDVDEQDTDAKSLLDRLGQRYGFGVIVEGVDSYLLVPTNASKDK